MQPEYLEQIKDYYLEDAKKHLQVIEQHLLNLQSTIEDPEKINQLFHVTRCSIVGGANMLPISQLHIRSIHEAGLCLVECFNVFQQESSVQVDQPLQDLLIQVFYTLKKLIEAMSESSGLTDEQVMQVMTEMESVRESLKIHLKELIYRSRQVNDSDKAVASDAADDVPTVDELQVLIDELLIDNSAVPNSNQPKSN
ncbi:MULTISPECIES: hypothetical protein [unclassified Coleofasciculus]|uniref:hypothetical protein n=1 Tax=unclassified Coleofasciculus TaxID=2692782 RepID=UPI00187FA7DE|nr:MULTISPECIES: hypothetical protein [unclassified Coleofasciculus]MBE9129014.1 hypothetical protein [Coleofasciculus sp. LEGE 07081]MBE9151565.1 hypothetical protein [Coleofasciculus sp. LEGE 07092]